jgi:hypothetical protein
MFKLPAFEIISRPFFIDADPCAEDEVRDDEAEEECESKEEEINRHD